MAKLNSKLNIGEYIYLFFLDSLINKYKLGAMLKKYFKKLRVLLEWSRNIILYDKSKLWEKSPSYMRIKSTYFDI